MRRIFCVRNTFSERRCNAPTPWLRFSKSFIIASGEAKTMLFTRFLPKSFGRRFWSQAFHCTLFHDKQSEDSAGLRTCFLWKSLQFGILNLKIFIIKFGRKNLESKTEDDEKPDLAYLYKATQCEIRVKIFHRVFVSFTFTNLVLLFLFLFLSYLFQKLKNCFIQRISFVKQRGNWLQFGVFLDLLRHERWEILAAAYKHNLKDNCVYYFVKSTFSIVDTETFSV